MAKEEKKVAEETPQAVEETAKPISFSELAYNEQVVIKNTNGAEQVVLKRAWEEIVKGNLDRLQGFELLGKYVKDENKENKKGYLIQPIEDDYEPSEEA